MILRFIPRYDPEPNVAFGLAASPHHPIMSVKSYGMDGGEAFVIIADPVKLIAGHARSHNEMHQASMLKSEICYMGFLEDLRIAITFHHAKKSPIGKLTKIELQTLDFITECLDLLGEIGGDPFPEMSEFREKNPVAVYNRHLGFKQAG